MTDQMKEPTPDEVERLARMAGDLSTLMGAAAATETAPDDTERRDKLLRSTGYHAEVAATLRALLSRAEQAEAERDRMKRDFAEHGGRYWEARCRDAETARDTAEAQRDAAARAMAEGDVAAMIAALNELRGWKA